ncbi:Fur family transcriptional regulator [Spartinivicinus poritis]|uniref:Fur family transcriptional regulator n=1 Tax=Spartinivicinus poritis TaxID=2994640 RepID=A0ABT5UCT1_9GAMM|nr:Fur family transcriptional regulator [Spartinivicinus sp. A2-2]MDE1464184.1 Fur family transcriptional regulator [Spartinivicinus sp. A2-2]
MSRFDKQTLLLTPHDHGQCIEDALERADELCRKSGVKLTELRRQVLELVWHSHKPLGAYDILALLSDQSGKKAAPPTVYRALDFLQEQGLVHRISSLNAFIGCPMPEHQHRSYFLICRNCAIAMEINSSTLAKELNLFAQQAGFTVENETVEVVGLCPNCQAEQSNVPD